MFNKFSAENMLKWETKLKCTTSWFSLPIYLKCRSGIKSQYGQGSHWRMRRQETEFASVSAYESEVSVRRRGRHEIAPLLYSNGPTHEPPAGAQSGSWKQGTIKITRICSIVSEMQWEVMQIPHYVSILKSYIGDLNEATHGFLYTA